MQNLLHEIVEHKKKELRVKSLELGKKNLKTLNSQFQKKSFYNCIGKAGHNVGIVAEIKLASPSAGRFVKEIDITQRVQCYEEAGADALSIVTDKKYFHGDSTFVRQAKKATSLPILQKDFIIDEIQIQEAKEIGSDALLLIARILEDTQLQRFVSLSQQYNIEPVVEIYDQFDLEKALGSGARIIAVNARDLDTFQVDISNACRLAQLIPKDKTILGFSGIEARKDVILYKNAGARAVLVGGVLMRLNERGDVMRKIEELKNK